MSMLDVLEPVGVGAPMWISLPKAISASNGTLEAVGGDELEPVGAMRRSLIVDLEGRVG